jgi:hypothetical protein
MAYYIQPRRVRREKQKALLRGLLIFLAERVGFEPTVNSVGSKHYNMTVP